LTVETQRLEAFADGVLAIAATVLIFNVTADAPGAAVGRAVDHAWPSYIGYVVSFLTIGMLWMNHHAMMRHASQANSTFKLLNVGLLMCIGFYPYPTRLIAEHWNGGGLRPAAVMWGTTSIAIGVMINVCWWYMIFHRKEMAPHLAARTITAVKRYALPGPFIWTAATLTGIWNPKLAVLFYAMMTLFYMFIVRQFEGD
jgi:uncharacterized membrane protein